MLLRIKNNAKYFFSCVTAISSMIFGLISVLQMFMDWDILGVESGDIKCKIVILSLLIISCVVLALVWIVFFSNSSFLYNSNIGNSEKEG